MTNLISNDPATRRLFQGKNVVGLLVERLGDGSDGVVMEASGALRNLAIDAGAEVVGEMYNKGLMGAVKGLVPRVSTRRAKRGEAGGASISRPKREYPERSEDSSKRPQGARKPAPQARIP